MLDEIATRPGADWQSTGRVYNSSVRVILTSAPTLRPVRQRGEAFTVTLPAVPVGQSPADKFREYLASRSRPQRFTDQQRDLVRYVFAQHNHFDADNLIDELKQAGLRVSRATVYRTLNKLVDAGLLRRLELG